MQDTLFHTVDTLHSFFAVRKLKVRVNEHFVRAD